MDGTCVSLERASGCVRMWGFAVCVMTCVGLGPPSGDVDGRAVGSVGEGGEERDMGCWYR